MDDYGRELTKTEKAKIRKAVEAYCANYDRELGCLPLNGGCYMNAIGYSSSNLCRYFREAILPTVPEVQAIYGEAMCKAASGVGRISP